MDPARATATLTARRKNSPTRKDAPRSRSSDSPPLRLLSPTIAPWFTFAAQCGPLLYSPGGIALNLSLFDIAGAGLRVAPSNPRHVD
jgi:hypothetical protein